LGRVDVLGHKNEDESQQVQDQPGQSPGPGVLAVPLGDDGASDCGHDCQSRDEDDGSGHDTSPPSPSRLGFQGSRFKTLTQPYFERVWLRRLFIGRFA